MDEKITPLGVTQRDLICLVMFWETPLVTQKQWATPTELGRRYSITPSFTLLFIHIFFALKGVTKDEI
jgi:hypothetical protein